MIKEYCIIYEHMELLEARYVRTTIESVTIPSRNIFDAMKYAKEILHINTIKEVFEIE